MTKIWKVIYSEQAQKDLFHINIKKSIDFYKSMLVFIPKTFLTLAN